MGYMSKQRIHFHAYSFHFLIKPLDRRFAMSLAALSVITNLGIEPSAHAILKRIPVPCAGALIKAAGNEDLDLTGMTSVSSGADGQTTPLGAFTSCASVYGLCGKTGPDGGAPYTPGPLDAGTPYADLAKNKASDVAPAGGFDAQHVMTAAGAIPSAVDNLVIQVVKRISNLYEGFNTGSNSPQKIASSKVSTMQQWRSSDNLVSFSGGAGPCTNLGACNITCGEGRPSRLSSIVNFPTTPNGSPGGDGIFAGLGPSGPPPTAPTPPPCTTVVDFDYWGGGGGHCYREPAAEAAFQAQLAAFHTAQDSYNAAVNARNASIASAQVVNNEGRTIDPTPATAPRMSDFMGTGPIAGAAAAPASSATCPGGAGFCGWPKHSVAYDDTVSTSSCAKAFKEYDTNDAYQAGDSAAGAPNPGNYQNTHKQSLSSQNYGFVASMGKNVHVDFRSLAWEDGTFLPAGSEGDCDLYFSQDYTNASTMTALMTGAYAQANWFKLNEVIEEIKKGSLSLTSANCRAMGTVFVHQVVASANTLNAAGDVCGKLNPEIQASCLAADQTQNQCLQKALVSNVQLGGFAKIAECEVYERANTMYEATFLSRTGIGMFNQLKNWATLGCIRAMGSWNPGTGFENTEATTTALTNLLNNCFPYAYAALFDRYLQSAPTPFALVPVQRSGWRSANLTPDGKPRVELAAQCQLKDNTPKPVSGGAK